MVARLSDDVVLRGLGVVLEPLRAEHRDGLVDVVRDGELHRLHYTSVPEPDAQAMDEYLAVALRNAERGSERAFVVRDARNVIVGCTRYYDIDETVPKCAIGYTWYAARAQRTYINTASKRLRLGHAFDACGARTVHFHTSHLNLRSQQAIERLGARKDGVLRRDRLHKDGSLRDTVCYSIVSEEWPEIRARLEERLRSEN